MTMLQRPPYKRVWALSWPTILSNLSLPLAGAVDVAVVGHLPDVAPLGAVGIGALIFGFLYWAFAFLRMATTGFVAQSFGARANAEVRAAAGRAAVLAGFIGLGLIALQGPIAFGFFYFIDGTAEIQGLARDYYDVRIWGAPAALLNFGVLGVLFGLQRMGAALITQLVLNGCNIVLDIIFVVGLGWGVEGVAGATVIAEYVAAGLGIFLVLRHLPVLRRGEEPTRLFVPAAVRSMLAINRDLMIRTLLVTGVTLHFMSASAGLDPVTLAVNTLLMQFYNFLAFGLDGFAHAVEALGGSAYGRREPQVFRLTVRACTVLSGLVAGLFTLFYALLGGAMIDLMTDLEAVRAMSREFLPWMVLMPLIGVWSFLLDGIFVGTIRAAEMRNTMMVSTAAYALAVALLLPALANHGLWLALTIFVAFRALTLAAGYPRLLREMSN